MLHVIIDESKWLRGEGGGKSRLLRKSDNKMCCWGFIAAACGVRKGELMERRVIGESPNIRDIVTRRVSLPDDRDPGVTASSPIALGGQYTFMIVPGRRRGRPTSYELNDNPLLPDALRKELLTLALATVGVKVEFVPKVEAT